MSNHICPKCSKPKCAKPMEMLKTVCALPEYVDIGKRKADAPTVSLTTTFPVDVYRCLACGYVELFVSS